MKTRKQIIEEHLIKGFNLGTAKEVEDTTAVDDEISLIFLSEDRSGFFVVDVCPRYQGDFEDVGYEKFKKYFEENTKWKTGYLLQIA